MAKKIICWARYILQQVQYERFLIALFFLFCPVLYSVQPATIIVSNISGKDWPFAVTVENYAGPITLQKSSDARTAQLTIDLDQLAHNTRISVPQVAGSLPVLRNLVSQTFYIMLRPTELPYNTPEQLFLSYSPETQSPEKQLPIARSPAPPYQASLEEIKSRPIPASSLTSEFLLIPERQHIPEIITPVTALPVDAKTEQLATFRTVL